MSTTTVVVTAQHDEATESELDLSSSRSGTVVFLPPPTTSNDVVTRPTPTKSRPIEIIRSPTRTPSQTSIDFDPSPTPLSTTQLTVLDTDAVEHTAHDYPVVGTITSWRGLFILLITCGAQLLDNVYMTGVNIMLPAIQREFAINSADLQWLISAYTLTFGGFLLLAGVLSDRYGRKHVFCAGMAWLSVWTLADGFAASFIQLAVFRALQGVGAAMTVPSGVGIISSFFVAQDRTRALTYFGAAGAVGFCIGLLLGGFLTSSLGWRYLFYLSVIVTAVIGILGWFILPRDRRDGRVRPRLDFLGAGLSTGGLILLSFVLSSGGEYGWSKPFIIVLLLVSVAMMLVFTYVEKRVSHPIMPLSLWKVPNFAAIWVTGFVMYGAYQVELYYITLLTQEVLHLSAGRTALQLLPMGCLGGLLPMFMSGVLKRFEARSLLLFGLACCTAAPIPAALTPVDNPDFWKHVLPTTLIGIVGIAVGYCTITVVLLASVPVSAKSLCGGMINTAFQLGGGVGLALVTAVVQATATSKGGDVLAQCKVGLLCCAGMSGLGLAATLFGVKNVGVATSTAESGNIH